MTPVSVFMDERASERDLLSLVELSLKPNQTNGKCGPTYGTLVCNVASRAMSSGHSTELNQFWTDVDQNI